MRVQKTLNKSNSRRRRGASGQALVEYSLITVIMVLAIGLAITLTGPAIGNVFSNVIYNAQSYQGTPITPYNTLSVDEINTMAVQLQSQSTLKVNFRTNTPAGPTCRPPELPGKWGTTVGNATEIPPTYVQC